MSSDMSTSTYPMPTFEKADQIWTPLQKQVFLSVADAIVPELLPEQASQVLLHLPSSATQRQRELAPEFARQGFKSIPYLVDCAATQISVSLSAKAAKEIGLLLSLLGTRPGCLALTGRIGPYQSLDQKLREQIFSNWLRSPLAIFRKASHGLRGIVLLVFYRFNQTAWEAIGYPQGRSDDWSRAIQNMPISQEAVSHYDYKFENQTIASQPQDSEIIVDTQVLVIDSGAGGGVAGSYLAQRGVRTLIVDKGIYLKPDQIAGREDQAFSLLYDGKGVMPSQDSSINILAGSTFGGGTTVNWSASLKPRHFVRKAWAEKYGLTYYNSPLFTSDLNAVCKRMGVAVVPIRHNIGNSLLAVGAQRAGHPVEPVPQNSGGHTHFCGKCQLGCISGQKQGGTVSWLKDAAEAGTTFMTNCYIEKILFDKDRRAIGALATVDGRKIKILASKGVVVSCGSIQTPALLLRSPQLNYNKQIGHNLRLHPATIVTGYYEFPIKPWEGGLLTMVDNSAEMLDPSGWGCKIEVIASSPSIHCAFNHFSTAIEHKSRMLRYSHSYTMVIICRDRDGGRIALDEQGKPRIEYTLSPFDQRNLLQGILRGADAHMMAGAVQICTAQVGVPVFFSSSSSSSSSSNTTTTSLSSASESNFIESTQLAATFTPIETIPRDLNDPAYKTWQHQIIKAGCKPYVIGLGSAHQMASCRMGVDPKTSALDPEGRVWGSKNLWVADASVMPESSGVNPMITTMASFREIARNIAKQLGILDSKPLGSNPSPSVLRQSRM